jgi:CHAT domain-containing protein
VAALPVVYGVDLPGRGRGPDAIPPVPRALVVADPGGNLQAAREEAGAVVQALGSGGGWRVDRLEGGAATHRAVREALAAPDLGLAHYAGHGSFGGRDGVESGLPLADHERLSIADVLALPRAPKRLILSGCETARTAADARAEGLGLAQAFIVAGAEVVVAATRRTDDRLAQRIMRAFYAAWGDRRAATAPEALRRAMLAVQQESPGEDWAGFRVLVP